jgi:nicotinate-nucleotide pyrophosphorylase (carboxylating)
MKLEKEKIVPLIRIALDEDISTGDVTSSAIFNGTEISEAYIIAKQEGIVCGTEIVRWVYECVDPRIETTILIADGDTVSSGDTAVSFHGPTKSLLEGERTALNFFQRMSGISSKTHKTVELLKGSSIKILDTRKTLPGFRMLDKYSVKTGGGTNHRIGLFDMVLIKDNHIKAAGSIKNAVQKIRNKWKDAYKIEIETTTLDEVKEALSINADIIMLDNMDNKTMIQAAVLIDGRAEIEISGNITEERIADIRRIPVNYISIGALTHSVDAFDWSMKFR